MGATLTMPRVKAYRAVWTRFPPVDVSVGAYLGYGEKKVGKVEDLLNTLKNSGINRGGVG